MEPLTLISATPSSFARMNHVALSLKGILFQVQYEIPWESKTVTPRCNPLEQLPILFFPDGRAIYNSAYIQTYIVEKYADRGPPLLPGDLDGNLLAKQIVALTVGSQGAVVTCGWEMRRKKEMQSQKWIDRHLRKVDGAMRAFNNFIEEAEGRPYVLGNKITIAEIGIVCAVGGIDLTGFRPEWRKQHPALSEYFDNLHQLKEFQETKPPMFDMTEEVVALPNSITRLGNSRRVPHLLNLMLQYLELFPSIGYDTGIFQPFSHISRILARSSGSRNVDPDLHEAEIPAAILPFVSQYIRRAIQYISAHRYIEPLPRTVKLDAEDFQRTST